MHLAAFLVEEDPEARRVPSFLAAAVRWDQRERAILRRARMEVLTTPVDWVTVL